MTQLYRECVDGCNKYQHNETWVARFKNVKYEFIPVLLICSVFKRIKCSSVYDLFNLEVMNYLLNIFKYIVQSKILEIIVYILLLNALK